jgi:MAF protein
MMKVILASSSPFRKELLSKLGVDFNTNSPDIDETRLPKETPSQLVYRLSEEKAKEVAKREDGLIIASDQVATLEAGNRPTDEILCKPHTHENAVKQLQKSSGKTVTFYTSLTLLNTNSNNINTIVETYKVIFKKLTGEQIENYLNKEKPYNCAGSFKSEALGVSLFERLEGNDPNTLIGLPLIQLVDMLKEEGFDVLSNISTIDT